MSLESEIASIPLRFDFYRYLAFKIVSSGLPQVDDQQDPAGTQVFTPDAQELITQFITYAISVWNATRPEQQTSPEDTINTLNQWWRKDSQQYQKERLIAN